MAGVDIDRELAALGVSPRWVALGVVGEKHLDPTGVYRTSYGPFPDKDPPITGERVVESALFSYLLHRTAIDDTMLAELLDLATSVSAGCSRTVANWDGLSHRQLARVAAHRTTSPEIRRLAAQKVRVMTLAAADAPEVDLLGLRPAPREDPSALKIRMFRFHAAWQRRLSVDERERVGGLLPRLRRAAQMKCHMPAFGLHVAPGSSDATLVSICFECNNMFFDGDGVFMFDGRSAPAIELLQCFTALSPAG